MIIDSNLSSTLKFPLKFMTEADIYPESGDMLEQLRRLEAGHDRVYYITVKDWFLFKNYAVDNVYSALNRRWYDETESVDGKQQGGIIPFPGKFTNLAQNVNVYLCDSVIE